MFSTVYDQALNESLCPSYSYVLLIIAPKPWAGGKLPCGSNVSVISSIWYITYFSLNYGSPQTTTKYIQKSHIYTTHICLNNCHNNLDTIDRMLYLVFWAFSQRVHSCTIEVNRSPNTDLSGSRIKTKQRRWKILLELSQTVIYFSH